MSLESDCQAAASVVKSGAAELHAAAELLLNKYQKLADAGAIDKSLAAEALAAVGKLLAIMEEVEEPLASIDAHASSAVITFNTLRQDFQMIREKLARAKAKAGPESPRSAPTPAAPRKPPTWQEVVGQREHTRNARLRNLQMMGLGIMGRPYGQVKFLRERLKGEKEDAGLKELYQLAEEAEKLWREARDFVEKAYSDR